MRWMFLQRKGYPWMKAAHHKIICDALTRVYRGACRRLIINIPPRYSKTETMNHFVAWTLGRHPDSEYILTSYAAQLATNNSWQIRELIQSPAYQAIFPRVALRADSSAKHEWRTTEGGIVYAAGTGGTITGYGAGKYRREWGGCIGLDDPHKADEARSEVIRAGTIDWFQNTLESRTNNPSETPIVLVMQRLHERDLAGWLLDGGNGEAWEHVCLPALRDDGSALWPEKHGVERLRKMREAAPYTFAGQYQQAPAPPEGNIFKPARLEIVDALPAGTRFVRAWDFAASVEMPGRDPDWTVGAKLGVAPNGRIFIADIERFRGGPDEVEAILLNTARRDGHDVRIRIPQDPGQAGKSQVASFVRLLSGFTVATKPISGDKVKRSEPFAAQVNVGNVSMLRASWNEPLREEQRMFPNGSHDDQCDALADAFDELNINTFGLLDFMRRQSEQAQDKQAQEQP